VAGLEPVRHRTVEAELVREAVVAREAVQERVLVDGAGVPVTTRYTWFSPGWSWRLTVASADWVSGLYRGVPLRTATNPNVQPDWAAELTWPRNRIRMRPPSEIRQWFAPDVWSYAV
jgi:hypothetical protein